jgi:hypothetical protein
MSKPLNLLNPDFAAPLLSRCIRPEASPNAGFMSALMELDTALHNSCSIRKGTPGVKRSKPRALVCSLCGSQVGHRVESAVPKRVFWLQCLTGLYMHWLVGRVLICSAWWVGFKDAALNKAVVGNG